MADGRDPFLLLKDANPVPGDRLTEVATASALRDVMEQIIATPVPAPDRRRARRFLPRPPVRRRRRVVIGCATALVVASVAWTVHAVSHHPTKPLFIGCYATADLNAATEIVPSDGRPPTETCADLWRAGAFGPRPVPPLVACVLRSGVVAVFPGTGSAACTALEIGPLEETPPSTAPSSSAPSSSAPSSSAPSTSGPSTSGPPDPVALRTALLELFLSESCLDEARARDIVRRELAQRGFADWTVETPSSFDSARPCASLGVDVPGKRVLLIPGPPRR